MQQMLQACNRTMWKLYLNDSFHIGYAQLHIDVKIGEVSCLIF